MEELIKELKSKIEEKCTELTYSTDDEAWPKFLVFKITDDNNNVLKTLLGILGDDNMYHFMQFDGE